MTAYTRLRDAYQRVAQPGRLEHRKQVRTFFAQFVGPRDLVFDVGANDGRYTTEFVALGCNVIAVEPNRRLTERLGRYGTHAIIEAACGPEPGTTELHIGSLPIFSTVSVDWRNRADSARWTGETITVPVVTLDNLIYEHGLPRYIKIDVEGYEAAVLRGLSEPVEVVSFEVQAGAPDLCRECFDRLERFGGYEYAVSFADRHQLETGWGSAATTCTLLERMDADHGDVFARRPTC